MDILAMAVKLFTKNGMVASFMVLGLITFIAYKNGAVLQRAGYTAVPLPFFWDLSWPTSAVL